jgi:hypothetical protein
VAFRKVLSRKQTRYAAVLRHLEADLRQPHFRHLGDQLAAVVHPDRSAMFDDIIY